MARHSRRVLRLSAGLGGSPSNFEEVRLKRMTDEELEAELVVEAVRLGFDEEIAAADQDAALSWVEEQTVSWFEALPPQE